MGKLGLILTKGLDHPSRLVRWPLYLIIALIWAMGGYMTYYEPWRGLVFVVILGGLCLVDWYNSDKQVERRFLKAHRSRK